MPTQAQITEALRSDPEFEETTDSFLMVSLVLAHGRMCEARSGGCPEWRQWLDHIEALLQEPLA